MASITADHLETRAEGGANLFGCLLFLGVFLFFWIGTNPYVDLSGEAALDPAGTKSNSINQIATLLLFLGMVGYGCVSPMRSMILQPRTLLSVILIWFLVTAVHSNYPSLSIKALILGIITMTNASIFLLLPATEKQFGKLLGIGTLIMLGFAYYGVVFLPTLSIHQASELREPMNAGFWRGHFPHKNAAAAAMVVASFFGLFVMSTWSRIIGAAILGLCVFFLAHTGGKTATAMLPAVLIAAFIFERYRFLRWPIAFGGVAAFNLLAVGSAVIKPFRELVNSFGVDPTFTNRADIWRFAFTAISDNPIIGYGIKSFWQTPELVYRDTSVTWAVAAYNGHNSYLDMWLQTGLPGLVLTLFLVLILPLRQLRGSWAGDPQANVTRLFVRVWLYTLFNACLESIFFESASFLWFTLAVALYSFRLRAFDLVTDKDAETARA